LDQTHIGFLFEQVGGKAVAQCVRRHSLPDRRPIGSGMNNAIELPRATIAAVSVAAIVAFADWEEWLYLSLGF
jgi:hypothetical protein